jgi:hypothetical protein
MIRKWAVIQLITVVGLLGIPVAEAAELQLRISVPHPDADAGTATNRLRLGTAASATSAFDPAFDLAAFPSPALSAVVRRPDYPAGQQALWWDIRADSLPQGWNIEISSDQPDALIGVSGSVLSGTQSGCAGTVWTLRDGETGDVLALTSGAVDYSYRNTAGAIRRLEITAAHGSTAPPQAPVNVWSPRQGRASVYVAWSGADDAAIKYHVYRTIDQQAVRLTPSPIAATTYLDTRINRAKAVTYHVTAVTESGCESPMSAGYQLAPNR